MANCNTKYNNNKQITRENFDGTDIAKGVGWTILAILCIAGIIALFFGLSKLF